MEGGWEQFIDFGDLFPAEELDVVLSKQASQFPKLHFAILVALCDLLEGVPELIDA